MSFNDDTRPQADYSAAHAALDLMANDLSLTDAQRSAAQRARAQLSLQFINKAQASFEARTAQYQAFIAAMTAAIRDISAGGPADGINGLTNLVTQSSALLAAAIPKLPIKPPEGNP